MNAGAAALGAMFADVAVQPAAGGNAAAPAELDVHEMVDPSAKNAKRSRRYVSALLMPGK